MKKIINVVLLLLFLVNTYLVTTDFYVKIDDTVHTFIYGFESSFVSKVMKIFTTCGSTVVISLIALTIVLILFLKYKDKARSLSIAAVIVVSTIINNVVKVLVRRNRPIYRLMEDKTLSYPSGHTMASWSLYGFLLYLLLKSKIDKKYKIIGSIILSVLLIMVPTSRIYFGMHYFSDILGGILASCTLILLFDNLNDKYKFIDK